MRSLLRCAERLSRPALSRKAATRFANSETWHSEHWEGGTCPCKTLRKSACMVSDGCSMTGQMQQDPVFALCQDPKRPHESKPDTALTQTIPLPSRFSSCNSTGLSRADESARPLLGFAPSDSPGEAGHQKCPDEMLRCSYLAMTRVNHLST